ITIDVALVDDDVADVDTDAKLDSAMGRNGSVAFGHRALDFHGAADRIHHARKFEKRAVTSRLDDPTTMLCNLGINKLAPMRLERGNSTLLVHTDQPAVTGDINYQDGGQPPFDPRFSHKGRLAARFGRKLMPEWLSRSSHPRWGAPAERGALKRYPYISS